ncbi:MFS transporter [Amycolatopsis sp. CA-230715]|uniref:MFS transporter n=1 Tax=Amycolatopsis sp. CA-230715 TaxID=2745196 RepID=UPI001C024EFE|nr:MFS transporter [Amycolatopsis sp. CA-230715]QWF80996.1 hypothetical protein HUW46_04421 [Amycolatopsis sp. CA-230715]
MRRREHGFAAALANREFRALWLVEALSVFGDQLARVALALLVFGRTGSASLSALTYALTFAPEVASGFLLSGLADRFPRRAVMVTTDLVRAGCVFAMVVPGLPLGVLWGLVAALSLARPPFKAAQQAVLPEVLGADLYPVGLGLRQITNQAVQVAGFGVGGVLVTAIGAGPVLLIDAGTFVVSAAVLGLAVAARPAARRGKAERASGRAPRRPDRRLLAVFMVGAVIGLLMVPEGLAAPYASAVGGASFTVGLLMAADPIGGVLGGWWAARSTREVTPRSVLVPAVFSGIPLAACAVVPGYVLPMLLWASSGALSTVFLVRLQVVITEVVPDECRGGVMGRFSTCVTVSQGVAIAGAGVVADGGAGPVWTVAFAGVLASVWVVVAGFVWCGARPRRARCAEDEHPSSTDGSDLLVTHRGLLPRRPAVGGVNDSQSRSARADALRGNGK